MNTNKICYFLGIFIFLFLFSSCLKDGAFDFTNVELELDSKWAANILNIDVALNEFNIESDSNSEFLIENQDNVLALIYSTSQSFSVNSDSLYEITLATTNINFQLQAPSPIRKDTKIDYTYSIDKHITFDLDEMLLDSVRFKNGILNMDITTDINHPFTMTVKSDAIIDKNGNSLHLTQSNTSPNLSFTINFKDKVIKFPNDTNSIPITFEFTIIPEGGSLNFPYHININNSLPSIGFSWIQGQSKTQSEYLTEFVKMSFLEDKALLNFKANEAKLQLEIKNNIGVPLTLRVDTFSLYNAINNKYTPLVPHNEILQLNYPNVKGNYATTLHTFNLTDFYVDNRRTSLVLKAQTTINPNGIDGNKYFVLDSSAYSIKTRIEVPLNIDLYNLSYFDTVEFKMDSINVDELDYAIFRIEMKNYFSFGLKTQVYFLNDSYQIIDSLFTAALKVEKAILDPVNNYHVKQASTSSSKVTINMERLDEISKAGYLLIKADAVVNSSDPRMIFYSDEQKLGIRLGIQTHIKTRF